MRKGTSTSSKACRPTTMPQPSIDPVAAKTAVAAHALDDLASRHRVAWTSGARVPGARRSRAASRPPLRSIVRAAA